MSNENFVILYITCKDNDEADKIVNALLKEKLIACANIFSVRSRYWWKNEIQQEDEFAIIAKTKKILVDDAITKVKELHSYILPCIIALPIIKGNTDFLKWIDDVTK